MARQGQTYVKNKGNFTWGNLRHLARSLGFQDDLFRKHIPAEHAAEQEGIEDHVLLFLINMKTFDASLHRTVNMQGAEYNNKVLKKGIKALRARQISFEELHDARVAFFCYEEHDMAGMLCEEEPLLKALKMCKRIVSPLYLMSEVRRLELDFSGRIQLYEFLDLFKISRPEDAISLSSDSLKRGSQDDEDISSVLDFEDILQTEEERKMTILNDEYKQSIYRQRKEKRVIFKKPLEGSVVHKDIRREQTVASRRLAQSLLSTVQESNSGVARARCGGRGGRGLPLTNRRPLARTKMERLSRQGDESRLSEQGTECVNEALAAKRPTPPLHTWHAKPIITNEDKHKQEMLIECKQWEVMVQRPTTQAVGRRRRDNIES